MTEPTEPPPSGPVDPVGCHLLTVVSSDAERRSALSAWVVEGLIDGQRFVYAEPDEPGTAWPVGGPIASAIAARGVDVESAHRSGQLVRLPMEQFYDVDFPSHVLAQARSGGFRAVRFATEARQGLQVLDRWSYLTFERQVDLACTDQAVSALCQYDPTMVGQWFSEVSGIHQPHAQESRVVVVPRDGALSLLGAVDVTNADQVVQALRLATRASERTQRIDLSGIDHLSTAGCRALVTGTETFRARGGRVHLEGAAPRVCRVLTVLGLDRTPGFTVRNTPGRRP